MKKLDNQATITDVARMADVSIATVSRALDEETRKLVAPETLNRIETVVRKCGYTPNLAARNMRARKLKTIGILLPHVPNVFVSDYYSKIFSGVSNALLDSDYRFKLIAFKRFSEKLDGHQFRSADGVDGLIVTDWPIFFSLKKVFEKVDVPCVIVGDPEEGVRAHFVCGDNLRGGELAAKYLYENGHERIAVLSGLSWSTDSRLRIEGFKRFFRRVGTAIPNEMIFQANYEEEDAARIVERLVLEKKKVTAIFCCNDNMAIGAIHKLKQLGVRCPGKISVVGYDDEARGQHLQPALTTVHVGTQELGQAAITKLLEFLKEGKKDKFYGERTVLPVSLIERQSVGSCQK
ncbi:MAG: LacI family DNA-binding transcriptional regulator [Candidatus Omnitrophica bacterium]|nr:LacI family DNA-binding transcriptional regulator [Candidatus Omnitrophota bacterium]